MKWIQTQLPIAFLSALCALSGESLAEPPNPPGTDSPKFPTREITEEEAAKERTRLEKEAFAAFAKNDYAAAEAALRELIPLDSTNFVPWYNLACALAMQEKHDDALVMLKQSIARGFADLREMQTDPHLASIRTTDEYKAIVASWSTVLEKRSQRTIDEAAKKFHVGEKGSAYILEKDEHLHLVYISAFDPILFKDARADAAKLERWWQAIAGEPTPSASPHSSSPHSSSPESPPAPSSLKTQQPRSLTPWVLVILPTRKDYILWAMERYGDRFDRVGGEYNHSSKMLVSMDLGSSWRHEFWHILHWRDMDQRGQRHPIWIMEGLCSLVEDCDTSPDGSMIPRPSWRTNMIKRLGKSGRLIPWDTIFASGQKGFMNERPLAYYGQARAMFLFLADQRTTGILPVAPTSDSKGAPQPPSTLAGPGLLPAWYAAYTATYKEDPTGKSAFEKVLNKPIKDIERDFRKWVAQLPEVADEVGRGPANLPVEVGQGGGEGPIVHIDAMADFMQPGASPKKPPTGGLLDKDIITAIDNKPTRDLNDLARVLGAYEPGALVTVSYIRGKAHAETKLKLVPPK